MCIGLVDDRQLIRFVSQVLHAVVDVLDFLLGHATKIYEPDVMLHKYKEF